MSEPLSESYSQQKNNNPILQPEIQPDDSCDSIGNVDCKDLEDFIKEKGCHLKSGYDEIIGQKRKNCGTVSMVKPSYYEHYEPNAVNLQKAADAESQRREQEEKDIQLNLLNQSIEQESIDTKERADRNAQIIQVKQSTEDERQRLIDLEKKARNASDEHRSESINLAKQSMEDERQRRVDESVANCMKITTAECEKVDSYEGANRCGKIYLGEENYNKFAAALTGRKRECDEIQEQVRQQSIEDVRTANIIYFQQGKGCNNNVDHIDCNGYEEMIRLGDSLKNGGYTVDYICGIHTKTSLDSAIVVRDHISTTPGMEIYMIDQQEDYKHNQETYNEYNGKNISTKYANGLLLDFVKKKLFPSVSSSSVDKKEIDVMVLDSEENIRQKGGEILRLSDSTNFKGTMTKYTFVGERYQENSNYVQKSTFESSKKYEKCEYNCNL
jgi:hypothetical protein